MGSLFSGGDPLSGFLMKGPDPLKDTAVNAGVPAPPMLDEKSKGGYG